MMDAVHIFNKMQKFWHAEMTQKFCEAFVGLGIVLHIIMNVVEF